MRWMLQPIASTGKDRRRRSDIEYFAVVARAFAVRWPHAAERPSVAFADQAAGFASSTSAFAPEPSTARSTFSPVLNFERSITLSTS